MITSGARGVHFFFCVCDICWVFVSLSLTLCCFQLISWQRKHIFVALEIVDVSRTKLVHLIRAICCLLANFTFAQVSHYRTSLKAQPHEFSFSNGTTANLGFLITMTCLSIHKCGCTWRQRCRWVVNIFRNEGFVFFWPLRASWWISLSNCFSVCGNETCRLLLW